MLKLKYLFDNRDLVKMILANWEYDEAALDLLNHFRISSNAIYPFKYNGKTRILRFAPAAEKEHDQIAAELDFIRHLAKEGYGALATVKAKNGCELITIATPWGDYHASVFQRVAGEALSELEYTPQLCRLHGQALARLHLISAEYQPSAHKRRSYSDILCWIGQILENFQAESSAYTELQILQAAFKQLPCNQQNFGLIHYDFEFDNLFYDAATNAINVINFDDSVYHWFTMDVERALNCIEDETPENQHENLKSLFLAGYREIYPLDTELIPHLQLFTRFANLYGYALILQAAAEKWQNEPTWLSGLRYKLDTLLKKRSALFGKDKT